MKKYTFETKLQAVKDYLSGEKSVYQICEEIGMTYNGSRGGMLRRWARRYKEFGEAALLNKKMNKAYSSELKLNAVKSYLSREGSLLDICIKYEISSTSVLRRWIKKYNANRELKDYNPKREVYMAEARRKTTIEERKAIVEYCLSHGRDYKETASKFEVSYSQVYSWVKKYDANGEDSLTDKRGRHKSDDEVDELERLRRENKRLKRQLEENEMLVQLLKKVKEFERM